MERTPAPLEFSLLLDGRLTPEQHAEWQTRLDADPVLAESFRQFSSAREVVAASTRLQALPPGFDARLRQRLRTEELRTRADRRARTSSAGRESWWQRTAIGVAGIAAGVCFMLALDYSGIFRTETSVTVPDTADVPPQAPSLTPRDVRTLVATKANKFEQFRSNLREMKQFNRTVPQQFFDDQVASAGLDDLKPYLLEIARQHQAEVGEDSVKFLTDVMQVRTRIAQPPRAQDGQVDIFATLALLDSITTPRQLRSARITVSRPAQPQEDLAAWAKSEVTEAKLSDWDAYALGRKFFDAADYTHARAIFEECLRAFSSGSPGYDTFVYYTAQAMVCSGNALGALQFLAATSEAMPSVLSRFQKTELEKIRDAALAPRADYRVVIEGGAWQVQRCEYSTESDRAATSQVMDTILGRYQGYSDPGANARIWWNRLEGRFNDAEKAVEKAKAPAPASPTSPAAPAAPTSPTSPAPTPTNG